MCVCVASSMKQISILTAIIINTQFYAISIPDFSVQCLPLVVLFPLVGTLLLPASYLQSPFHESITKKFIILEKSVNHSLMNFTTTITV